MRYEMKRVMLGLALLALACGETTQGREEHSGNTNWLKACDTDQECGELRCACGLCRTPCPGTTDCSLDPADSCVAGSDMLSATGPAPVTLREHRDPAAYAEDLAIDASGNVILVGGTDRTTFDLTPSYPTFWASLLDEQGDELWSYRETPTEGEPNTGRSVAPGPYGEVLALQTIYDGSDTPLVRRFYANGSLMESWSGAPGFTTLRGAGAFGVFAAGSNLLEMREGRPFTSAWVGRLDATGKDLLWQHEWQGTDGSVSNIVAASSNSDGELVVGGSLGVASDSNASEPWLARLDVEGTVRWQETVRVPELTHCDAGAVALTADGGSIAAIGCGALWVRGYDASGAVRWERRFANGATALAGMADGGYVAALGGGEARLQRFDSRHRLRWETTQPGCRAFERLAVTDEAVVALAGCDEGFVLSWFADP